MHAHNAQYRVDDVNVQYDYGGYDWDDGESLVDDRVVIAPFGSRPVTISIRGAEKENTMADNEQNGQNTPDSIRIAVKFPFAQYGQVEVNGWMKQADDLPAQINAFMRVVIDEVTPLAAELGTAWASAGLEAVGQAAGVPLPAGPAPVAQGGRASTTKITPPSRVPEEMITDTDTPVCPIHNVPMTWRQGVSKKTNKPYAFWSCGMKNADGTWCPEKG